MASVPPNDRPPGSSEDSQASQPSLPEWALGRPGAARRQRRLGWRTFASRRRVLWLVAILAVVVAFWNSYPFVPNIWVSLFRQPSGDASAVSGPGSWAMRAADARGSNRVVTTAPPAGILERTIDVDSGVRSGPVVAGGLIYIGGQSRILAIEADTGELAWESPASGPVHGVPAIAGGRLYLGNLNKRVFALDAATGEEVWTFAGDSPFPGTMAIEDGIVYAASRGGNVHALDAETGRRLWTVGLDSAAVAPVAVDDGRLLAASSGGVLFIRNGRTGDKRSRIRTGSVLVAPPTAVDGFVFLISDGGILAFDSQTRELPGRYPAELIWAQLWIWGFPLPDPQHHAGLQWGFHPASIGAGSFEHPPTVAPEALYLGTGEGEVLALSPEDGSLLWRADFGSPVVMPTVLAGDLLILAQESGWIRAVDRHSREEVWAANLGSVAAGPLALADGRVFVATSNGKLHIIR